MPKTLRNLKSRRKVNFISSEYFKVKFFLEIGGKNHRSTKITAQNNHAAGIQRHQRILGEDSHRDNPSKHHAGGDGTGQL